MNPGTDEQKNPFMSYVKCCFVFLLAIFLTGLGCNSSSQANNFGFDDSSEGWSISGEGTGYHVKGIGHQNAGAIYLANNKDQQVTLHKKFNLKPGRYKITAWTRALDVQKGKWDYSLWFFYKTREKIQSPVTNLQGTFGWSEITYTIEVEEREVDIWFRLKSQGLAWIDDVSVTPFLGKPVSFNIEKASFTTQKPNRIGNGIRCSTCYRWMPSTKDYCFICGNELPGKGPDNSINKSESDTSILFDFEIKDREKEVPYHYFRHYSNTHTTSGDSSVELDFSVYNNFKMTDPDKQDWSGFDYLAMDVFNPLAINVKYALSLGDQKGGGYWNSLNHYTMLSPGWNYLKFHVKRYVGERGSVRVRRYLNLKKIIKFWFAIAPEDKRKIKEKFYVDNIRLLKAPPSPESFPGLLLFDFVKDGFRVQNGFTGIESKHNYHKDIGFGFADSHIWKIHDSVYADTLNRDGIFLNKGEFYVDVPNGKYVVRLTPWALGYWYEHFWTKRKIVVEGDVVLDQVRLHAKDYIQEFLRFENIEPTPGDNPYDLYLKSIFSPLVTEIEVNDGQINLQVEGDDSGVLLNSLIIYPAESKNEGEKYLQELSFVLKDEYETLCRPLISDNVQHIRAIKENDRKRGFYTALIENVIRLRYNQVYKSIKERIVLQGGRLERPVQSLMIRNLKEAAVLKVTSSPLQSESGEILSVKPEWIRYGVAQYMSHSANHETYELAPRFLRNLGAEGVTIKKDYSLLVWYQVQLDKSIKSGRYKGQLEIILHGERQIYPIELQVLDYELPSLDIAAGFFGLEPVLYSYYKQPDVSAQRRDNRNKVLKIIFDRGFTTWSSLPESKFVQKDNFWSLKADDVDQLMIKAREIGFRHKIFTYGGTFPVLLDKYGDVDGTSHELFRSETSSILQGHIKTHKWLPVVYDISDEASGYSQKVNRDLKRAEMLQSYFPYLRTGGYTHPIEEDTYGFDLNRTFSDISLSSVTRDFIATQQYSGNNWGVYKPLTGIKSDYLHSLGRLLYSIKKYGGDHFLAWHLSLNQNYPYFDLDGREGDAMMIYPRIDGSYDYSLNFEWATLGIENYRLLLLLQELLKNVGNKGDAARKWLKGLNDSVLFIGDKGVDAEKERSPTISGSRLRERVHSYLQAIVQQDSVVRHSNE